MGQSPVTGLWYCQMMDLYTDDTKFSPRKIVHVMDVSTAEEALNTAILSIRENHTEQA